MFSAFNGRANDYFLVDWDTCHASLILKLLERTHSGLGFRY
jgi:hypothetical protein